MFLFRLDRRLNVSKNVFIRDFFYITEIRGTLLSQHMFALSMYLGDQNISTHKDRYFHTYQKYKNQF